MHSYLKGTYMTGSKLARSAKKLSKSQVHDIVTTVVGKNATIKGDVDAKQKKIQLTLELKCFLPGSIIPL